MQHFLRHISANVGSAPLANCDESSDGSEKALVILTSYRRPEAQGEGTSALLHALGEVWFVGTEERMQAKMRLKRKEGNSREVGN